MSSSASPWQKYSWSFSGLRSVNGSTTIEERLVGSGLPSAMAFRSATSSRADA